MTDVSKEQPTINGLCYDDAVVQTGKEVRRLLMGAPVVIRHMTAHLAKATGKMIRARALLVCAIDSNGRINPDAVKAAAAVELVHLATLIHDDICDDAGTRRGIAALHRKFGEKYAVLCGDYLFCRALDFVSTAATLEHKKDSLDRTVPRYLTEVCLGELRQNQNSGNYQLTEREYFKTIRGKTAALFEACFHVGFMFSDEADAVKDSYKQIGGNIGLIFQLADDCADYEATDMAAKKPVLSDFSRGVITLPLIYALKVDATLPAKIKAGMEPRALKDAIATAGGLAYTHAKIDRLYKKTKTLIASLDTSAEKKELLTWLLRKSSGLTA